MEESCSQGKRTRRLPGPLPETPSNKLDSLGNGDNANDSHGNAEDNVRCGVDGQSRSHLAMPRAGLVSLSQQVKVEQNKGLVGWGIFENCVEGEVRCLL